MEQLKVIRDTVQHIYWSLLLQGILFVALAVLILLYPVLLFALASVTFLLVGLTVRDAVGTSNTTGVETELAERFTAAKRPISGLETAAQQLGFFNTLSEAEQRRFLEDTVETSKTAKSDYKAMLRAWLTGNDKAIASSFDTENEISPVLRDVLIRKRNIAWADWLAKRLNQPGQLLVAVGAGHLAGPDSVQRKLAARGIKVTRVQ